MLELQVTHQVGPQSGLMRDRSGEITARDALLIEKLQHLRADCFRCPVTPGFGKKWAMYGCVGFHGSAMTWYSAKEHKDTESS